MCGAKRLWRPRAVGDPRPKRPKLPGRCLTVLPDLLAAAGVAALQAYLQRVRLLYVLRDYY